MKTRLLNIFILAAFIFSFSACNNDEDKMYAKPINEVNAPVLSSEGFTEIKINETNYELTPLIFNWSKSDFGEDVLVEYTLEIADNNDFSNSQLFTIGNNQYTRALKNSELSEWTIKYFNGLDEQENPVKVELFVRISATISLENPSVIIKPGKVYSNVIEMQVTPHFIPSEFPTEMYMIGKEFGNWDWSSDQIVEMIPVHSNPGHFWCIRYITTENGFKWNSKREWGGDFYSLGEDIGFITDEGNAFIKSNGLYMVYIDMPNKRISVETAKVYGMGDCFGGWNTGSYPFSIDDKSMKITTVAEGELRMYADSDISAIGGDWWKMEFIIFNGKITYRGTGDDQDRVKVKAEQEITLDFNKGTGSIK